MRHLVTKHFGWQVITVMAVILGAALLMMGVAAPQAHSQENSAAKDQGGGQEKTPKEETPTKPSEPKEQVLDKDPQGNEVVAGELLVTYKKGAFEKAKDEAPKKVSGKIEKGFPEIEVQHISVPEVKNEKDQKARQKALKQKKEDLEANPNVEAVEYNQVVKPGWTPNDPDYGKQWGYQMISAPQAWDRTQGSSSVKVAVIDTGIDSNHPDLKDKIVAQYDFANNDSQAEETSDGYNGHGTHVAGTIAASTNNGTGVSGTCPNCKLLIAKYWHNGSGSLATEISSINWAVANGANVINMSFGSARAPSTAEERAINDAWNKGVILVACAQNDGRNDLTIYPAAYDKVMAVANTTQSDQRNASSNAGDWVDVAAPGTDIYSTLPGYSYYSGGQWKYVPNYGYMSGTSMATPHVSGLAGLLFSKSAGDNSRIRYLIESWAQDLGTTGKDPVFGNGRINAYYAVAPPFRNGK